MINISIFTYGSIIPAIIFIIMFVFAITNEPNPNENKGVRIAVITVLSLLITVLTLLGIWSLYDDIKEAKKYQNT